VIHGVLVVALQEHPAGATTLTDPDPPAARTERVRGGRTANVQLLAFSACTTGNALSAIANVVARLSPTLAATA
jgi:hypothetical protein